MSDALGRSKDVLAFLDAGNPKAADNRTNPSKSLENLIPKKDSRKEHEKCEGQVAVTFRIPRAIANGLIDASVDRRKKRLAAWSQQDIASEALQNWLDKNQFLGSE